ncbi:hypothetical protein SJC03_170 [Bacteroides phage SJC03]|nr:hypothetical protein SJC03_170 [Bacteroides phage SJC03]
MKKVKRLLNILKFRNWYLNLLLKCLLIMIIFIVVLLIFLIINFYIIFCT